MRFQILDAIRLRLIEADLTHSDSKTKRSLRQWRGLVVGYNGSNVECVSNDGRLITGSEEQFEPATLDPDG